jgi:hypothetical protein
LGNKIERTVRYLGIEVDDALAISRRLNYRAKPTGFAAFYAELGSVRLLKDELEARSVTS